MDSLLHAFIQKAALLTAAAGFGLSSTVVRLHRIKGNKDPLNAVPKSLEMIREAFTWEI
jgi:hypothetical protein